MNPKENDSFRISKKTGKFLNPCFDCRKKRKEVYNRSHTKINNSAKERWAKKNPEKIINAKRKWKENNIGRVKADKAKRKLYVAQATPKWLDAEQLECIACYYEMAQLRTECLGIEYQVDHIIPVRGKNVCGLNVPWNLEVITKKENLWKSNKLLSWRKSADNG